jgi:hypothetical protein
VKEAKGATAAGGSNSDTVGRAPPPEEIVMGYTQPLWGKFWEGGLHIGGWADVEDKAGAEFPNAEGA